MSQPTEKPERSSEKLGLAVGAIIALMVLGVYGLAAARDVWPSGHPWIGMIWAVIGYMTLRMAVRTHRAPRWMYWTTLAMPSLAAPSGCGPHSPSRPSPSYSLKLKHKPESGSYLWLSPAF